MWPPFLFPFLSDQTMTFSLASAQSACWRRLSRAKSGPSSWTRPRQSPQPTRKHQRRHRAARMSHPNQVIMVHQNLLPTRQELGTNSGASGPVSRRRFIMILSMQTSRTSLHGTAQHTERLINQSQWNKVKANHMCNWSWVDSHNQKLSTWRLDTAQIEWMMLTYRYTNVFPNLYWATAHTLQCTFYHQHSFVLPLTMPTKRFSAVNE